MREKELEQRQMEMAKIVTVLNAQQEKLREIMNDQIQNARELETLYNAGELDIVQIEAHRDFGIKLAGDIKNQERIIENTKYILKMKQQDVQEAYKKAETLKKLKEKQQKEFYKEYLHQEMKEIDDITSARFKIV